MVTGSSSFFFNNFRNSREQDLLESLIVESISIYGLDTFYVPRTLVNADRIYGADDQSQYNHAFNVCMYIDDAEGFTGQGSFMSKLSGIQINDQITFSMSKLVFDQNVGKITKQPRPGEGDLIYFPLNDKCFRIEFVDKFEMFYQLGRLYTWKMTCELFEYSSEIFNTGIPEIDRIQKKFDLNILDWGILDTSGNYLLDEHENYIQIPGSAPSERLEQDDSDAIRMEAKTVIDWSIQNPFSEDVVSEGEVPDSVQPSSA